MAGGLARFSLSLSHRDSGSSYLERIFMDIKESHHWAYCLTGRGNTLNQEDRHQQLSQSLREAPRPLPFQGSQSPHFSTLPCTPTTHIPPPQAFFTGTVPNLTSTPPHPARSCLRSQLTKTGAPIISLRLSWIVHTFLQLLVFYYTLRLTWFTSHPSLGKPGSLFYLADVLPEPGQ